MSDVVRLSLPDEADKAQTAVAFNRVKAAADSLSEPIQMILLVASRPVVALEALAAAARAFNVLGLTAEQFRHLSGKVENAEAGFRQAMREELFAGPRFTPETARKARRANNPAASRPFAAVGMARESQSQVVRECTS
jgi:hypothetical protein